MCKTSVARRILAYAWSRDYPIGYAAIHRFDALKHFGASVDACLLVVRTAESTVAKECAVFDSLDAARSISLWREHESDGSQDHAVIDAWAELLGIADWYAWLADENEASGGSDR